MSHGPDDAIWRTLRAELDRWSEAGRTIRLWLRDDDAIAPGPALDKLASLGARFDLPVLLAVIPMLAQPALAEALRTMPSLLPCQHGCWHRNHAPEGAKKSEFGPLRPAADIHAEIALARQRLGDLLGPALLPVFVPPWNRMAPAHAAILPGLGFAGLSCFRGYELGPGDGPALGNTHLDIMDWGGGRVGRRADMLIPEICRLLAAKRTDANPGDDAFGVLMHHRDHDATAWTVLETILAVAARHEAVIPTDPRSMFAIPIAPQAPAV